MLVLFCLLFTALFTTPFSVARVQKQSEKTYEVVASIPTGDFGIHYRNVGVPEAEVTGPASFRVLRDGSFVIADTDEDRIVVISRGVVVREIRVPEAQGIADLAITPDGDILALDLAQRRVHLIQQNKETGQKHGPIEVPADADSGAVTGITVSSDGQPAFDLNGGSRVITSKGNELRKQLRSGAEITVNAPDLNDPNSNASVGSIRSGDQETQIAVSNLLGGVRILGTDRVGNLFVVVTEVSGTDGIQVDETIRKYDANLKLLGIARVPVNERFTFTQRGLDLADDGTVFAMIPRADRLDIVRLYFQRSLTPLLPEPPKATPFKMQRAHAYRPSPMPQVACSRSRRQMVNAANQYLNNRVYLTTTNLTGTCSGRTAPRYLGTTAGYKDSVAYDWGGNDAVSDYNSYMSQGYQAGDIPIYSSGVESCSRGVDCSGFVSRVWGRTTKYSTTTLPNISTRIYDLRELQEGDILNLYNSHVVIFNGMANGGINAWESTINLKYDRVVYGFASWTRLSNYLPYRYNEVCSTGSVSLSASPISVYVSRGSTAFFNVYAYTADGFSGSVNLYALNLPGTVLPGTGFSPQTININSNNTWYTSTLTIVTNSYTPTGTRTVTIEGRSGSRVLRTSVQLTVR